MKLVQIENQDKLNNFIGAQQHSQFLQSWEWGEFQQAVGNKIMRLGVEDNGKLTAAATLIKKPLSGGKSYFYCPRAPVGETTELLFKEIGRLAQKEDVIFLRFEPQFKIPSNSAGRQNYKFKIQKTIDIQPSKTLILDLSKTKEELLANMHQKTRYNIRLAKKKGVEITEAGPERFNEFWQLMRETVKRDDFRLHNRGHYEKLLSINDNYIRLLIAEYKDRIIAANMVSFFGDTAAYLHGASGNDYRNVMAPYLLQWRAIKTAKDKGCQYYDFFGIDKIKWPGVTRFKKGFGGNEVEYPGTFDLVYNKPWYTIYKLARKARRFI